MYDPARRRWQEGRADGGGAGSVAEGPLGMGTRDRHLQLRQRREVVATSTRACAEMEPSARRVARGSRERRQSAYALDVGERARLPQHPKHGAPVGRHLTNLETYRQEITSGRWWRCPTRQLSVAQWVARRRICFIKW